MKKLIDNRWFLFAMPMVIWFMLLVLPFLPSAYNNIPEEIHHRFLINVIISNFLLLCLFYIHTYLLYPLINNKKWLWYLLLLLTLLGLYWLCWTLVRFEPHHGGPFQNHNAGREPFRNHPRRHGYEFGTVGFIPVLSPLVAILCSICYRVILDNRIRQQLLKERENVHLQSELTFLRSQISPHFMFNVLNNLVSLARKKSDDLEPALMNLSQLMRYMLYESDDHRVPLSKEIVYLKSYINLQMLRYGSNVTVNLDINGNTDFNAIEPMLLIPFVENAFKHGIGMIDKPVIDIAITIDEKTHALIFRVRNQVSPLDASKDNSSGIGISNVKRRLVILYPNKHELDITTDNNSFTISLVINLSN